MIFFMISAHSQLRLVHSDFSGPTSNQILNVSFYTPSTGFVAGRHNGAFVGFTTDSGRTYVKRPITLGNVDYGTYNVNLTFGFGMSGVKAFDQNNIIVYGDYGFVPAILKSTNGGLSYVLVFLSQFQGTEFSFMNDLSFPENNMVGFACDDFRIFKTTNGGTSWSTVYVDPMGFGTISALDNNNVYVSSNFNVNSGAGKLVKTTNGGSSWQTVNTPSNVIFASTFLTTQKGWISVYSHNGDSALIYYTANAGSTWTKQNNGEASPVSFAKMKFIDDNTGYGIGSLFYVSKTSDGGKTWELLPRDNNTEYLGFGHNDIHFASSTQFWASGDREVIELTTNGGGTPFPAAYFKIDTNGIYHTNVVTLANYSNTSHSTRWLLNGNQISTDYSTSFVHDLNRLIDTVDLIVTSNGISDTNRQYQHYFPRVVVSSFTPTQAATGTVVTINGQFFNTPVEVAFGNVNAAAVLTLTSTQITAVVGAGASGEVRVRTTMGRDSLPGFIYLPPPTISSFTPTTAPAGTVINITGTNFSGVTSVTIGGVSASYTVISPTTIEATAPSGPSGSITVTTTGGSATLAGFVSQPTVTSFTPTQGTHGTIMTITGTSFNAATAVSVGGVPVVSFNVISSTMISAVVSSGASGLVSVSTAGGSSALGTFTWFAPPVITNFSPASGPIGTLVTISGTGFHGTIAGNTVYFGSVQATVTAATATSLTVTVPTGATFENISVLANNLVGYSAYPFLVTFPNGGVISNATFHPRVVTDLGQSNGPTSVSFGDLDGDGKADAVVSHYGNGNNNGIYIYRNTSTTGNASFDAPYSINPTGNAGVGLGDLDGDGKLDLAIIGISSKVRVMRNNSTPGNLSFVTGIDISVASSPSGIAIDDVDADGKADIAITCYPDMATSIIRNVSEPGAFAFATPVSYPVRGGRNILLHDMDGDKKPELLVPNAVDNELVILKNNCTKGNISYGPVEIFPGYTHSHIAAGDMDGDGKSDLITGDHNGSLLFVMRNTTSGGPYQFEAPIQLIANVQPTDIKLSDIDGDGKLDIATVLANYNLAVFKNNSSTGNLQFSPKIDFTSGSFLGEHSLALGDVDGDGKNDAIVVAETDYSMSVYINATTPNPFILSFTPTSGGQGTVVTITGANFNNVSAVRFGNVPAASFTVNSPTQITAIVGAGETGAVSVVNNLGTGSLAGFVFGETMFITGISPLSGPVGTTVTITGNNFGATAAENLVRFGTVKAQVISASSTSITVEVPFNSTLQPVTVTANQLVAESPKPFTTTFPGAGTGFANAFAPRYDVQGLTRGIIGDVDGDGKLDLLGSWNGKINISRNLSLTGNLNFAAPVTVHTIPGSTPDMKLGDIDGDGKLDIVMVYGPAMMSVLRNTSSPGSFSFGPRLDYSLSITTSNPSGLEIRDLDKDGMLDILVSNYSTQTASVFRNITTNGNIDFAPRVDYGSSGYANGLAAQDMDGDNKPDMIGVTLSDVSISRNTSNPGTITLAPKVPIGDGKEYVRVGDLDGDGKADIAAVTPAGGGLRFYRNNSTVGSFSFSQATDVMTGTMPMGIDFNDLDGDGKADVSVSNFSTGTISLLKNQGTTGNIAFAPKWDYSPIIQGSRMTTGDLDNDGRPEVVIFQNYEPVIILRNITGGVGPSITDFTPVSAGAGATITITGSGFINVTAVSFGNIPAASFTVVSPTEITAVLGTGATGDVVVSTANGVASLNGFVFGTAPHIASITPGSAVPGTQVTITGANFTGVTSVNFGGTAVAAFTIVSPTQILATLGSGSPGTVSVSSPAGTGTYDAFNFMFAPTITSFSPAISWSGATVTITGTNLAGTSSVKFGGIDGYDIVVVSPTTVTAKVNNGTSGTVSVTTPAGTATLGGFLYQSSASVDAFFPTSATTGMTVQITGRNFSSVSAVKFGGVDAASYTILSPTKILAVVGAGASGSVSTTNPFGNSSLPGFTYISTSPLITSIAPSVGSTGTVITITGGNFTGATSVTIGGMPASNFTVVSASIITATVGSGASGNVVVTTGNGNATIAGFEFITTPIITSVTPSVAIPGSSVVITGSGFNNVPASNIVYFGGVRASVTTASGTSLTVTVPVGAGFAPVSVTNGGLIAYSGKSFLSTFPGSGGLHENSFILRVDSTSMSKPSGVAFADIDGDGKTDLAVPNSDVPRNISFFRNTSTPSTVSLAPAVVVPNNNAPRKTNHADFNGDGKLDLVVSLGGDLFATAIYENTSTVGNISYGTPIILNGGLGGFRAVTGDFDRDGKTDVAFLGFYSGSISIYKNTSSGGSISFAPRVNFPGDLHADAIYTDDIDGDGRTDFITGSSSDIVISRNTSTQAALSFERKVIPLLPTGGRDVATGDFDGDGKPDIAITNNANTLSIYRNISSPGNVSFMEAVTYITNTEPNGLALGDLDGDGTIDIAVTSRLNNTVSVFANKSTAGSFSFDPKVDYPLSSASTYITAADVDGDGITDLAVNNGTANSVTILRNLQNATSTTIPVSFCPNGNAAFASNVSGATYQWQLNSGTGFTNISNNSNYAGVATPNLQLTGIPAAWAGYEYRCMVNGTNYSHIFKLVPSPTVTPAVTISSSATTACEGTALAFTAVSTNGGSAPAYQWQVNGVNTGSNSNVFTTTTLTDGAIVRVIMTSNASCIATPTATSNTITVSITPSVTPAVSITSSATAICAGTSVTFTAAPVNGGTTPVFQWKVNNINAGTNSNTFTTTTLASGDQVKVIMTSSETCLTGPTATSNPITITVNTNLTPAVSITSSSTAICPGNPVTFTATPVNGGSNPSYQWKVDGINAGGNSNIFTTNTLNGTEQVNVVMTSNETCLLTPTATSNTIALTVVPVLTPSVTISTGATTVCSGAAVTFTATPVNGGTTPVYQWLVNGTNAGTNANTFTSNTLLTGSQVSVIMTSSLTCASPASATSNTLVMTVDPVVTPSVSITASHTTACAGNPVTFTATPVNGGATPQYQWQVNGINMGSNSNIFSTATLTTGAQVKVIMTSSATCTSTGTATSNIITVTINPVVLASVTISASATTSCPGYPVTFTATPVNGGTAPAYQWQVNGANEGSNSNVFTTPIYTSGTTVRAIMTSNATCVSVPVVTSNLIPIALGNFVVPFGTITGTTVVQSGQSTAITVMPGNAGSAAQFQWQDSTDTHDWQDITGANAFVIDYVPVSTGDRIRCVITSSLLCANPVSVNSNSLEFTVNNTGGRIARIYPNPVTELLTIDMLDLAEEWITGDIYNMNGGKLFSVNLEGKTSADIIVTHLRAGHYIIKLTRRNGQSGFVKFVKL